MTFQFSLGWPQLIWVAIVLLADLVAIVHHGKPRPPFNAYVSVSGTMISLALLYWGGFFG